MAKARAVVALLVLALFPVAVLTVLGLIGWLGAALFRVSGVAGVRLILFLGLPLLVAAVGAVRHVLRARPKPLVGVDLLPGEHPRLWAEVTTLATGVDTAAPARIVVDGSVNAAVSEADGTREMLIGFPLLATMTRDELRSVLAHELGHYGAGHTRLLALTYRARTWMETVHTNSSGPVRWLVGGAAWVYKALAASANRQQEHEADAYSARVAGPLAAASALRRLVATGLAWNHLARNYMPLTRDGDVRPSLVEGLHAVAGAEAEAIGDAVEHVLHDRRVRPLDSHPPVGVRVSRFEAAAALSGEVAARATGGSAWELLGTGRDGRQALDRLEAELVDDPRPVGRWEVAVAGSLARAAVVRAGHLTRSAMASGAVTSPTLGALLDAVRLGLGRRLVASLVDPAVSPGRRLAAEREVLVSSLCDAVTAALVTAGAARYTLRWNGPAQLELVAGDPASAGQPFDPEDLVRPVVREPGTVADLELWLAEHGVDVRTGAAPVEAPEPVPTGVVLCAGASRRTEVHLVVCDTGLLAVPVPRQGRLRTAVLNAGGVRVRREREALLPVVEQGHRALTQLSGARWFDTDDVVAARLRGVAGWTLQLRLRDGEEVTFTERTRTAEVGSAMSSLRTMLGARLDKDGWKATAAQRSPAVANPVSPGADAAHQPETAGSAR